MSRGAPFDGVRLLLVDGNNLLHRTAGGPGPVAARILLGQLRATMPPGMNAIVVLDGPPDPGGPMRETAGRSLEIRHAGRLSADDVIVGLVAAQPFEGRSRTVVVSDDRALRDRVARLGGVARRLHWLEESLTLPRRGPRSAAGSSIAGARPALPAAGRPTAAPDAGTVDDPDGTDERRWEPGRGATRKRGNAHRGRPDR
jgi:hypothetical protein